MYNIKASVEEVVRYLKKGGDAMGGSLSMGNNRITTLGSPADDLDGVNRGWVKKRFLTQGTADGHYLAKDGGACRSSNQALC